MEFLLPDNQAVIEFHQLILNDFGGLNGIPHPEYIEAAIARPKNYMSYEEKCDLHLVGALLLEAIARNHAFADGNKRTALVIMILTYRMNGTKLSFNLLMNEKFEDLVLWVTKEKPSIKMIYSRLKELVEEFAE